MKQKYYTVAMRRQTYERLKDYKMGGGTYDQVLNQLMDALPLEEVSEEVLKEHRRRLKSSRWVSLEEVRKALGDD
jgi:hypothetical protein